MGTGIKPSPLFPFGLSMINRDEIKKWVNDYLFFCLCSTSTFLYLKAFGRYGTKLEVLEFHDILTEMILNKQVYMVKAIHDGVGFDILFYKGTRLIMENSVASVAGTSNSDT